MLKICDKFDEINFDTLPISIIIKCNHGSKWQYVISDKNKLLSNKRLYEKIKRQMIGWLEQEYCYWGGFEMQYKNIKPKILIEPLLRESINLPSITVNVYCLNGNPIIMVKFFDKNKMSIWDEKYNSLDNIFNFSEQNIKTNADDYIKQTFVLSKFLSIDFKFVRVDWMIYKKQLYFEELTFTPYSGFLKEIDADYNKKLGKLLTTRKVHNELQLN